MSRPDSPRGIQTEKLTATKLSPKLDRTLLGYAAAASAAGVGLLALVEPSQAQIVYTKAHTLITPNTTFSLDLNNDGIADFTFTNTLRVPGGGLRMKRPPTCTGTSCFATNGKLTVKGALASNQVVGFKSSFGLSLAKALPSNSRVGSSAAFLPNGSDAMLSCYANNDTFQIHGSWGGARYLGLKFTIGGQTHYGWARFTVYVTGFNFAANCKVRAGLTGYAYQTQPNTPIFTRQEFADDTSLERTLEPASLGRLAQGAQGVSAWRGNENTQSGK